MQAASASASAPTDTGVPPKGLSPADRDDHEKRVRMFYEFLNSSRSHWEKTLDTELANGRYRIPLDLKDLRKAEAGLDRQVLETPVKYLLPWEEALMMFLKDVNEKACKQLKQPLRLDIQGSFGRNHVTPRGVTCGSLQQLIKVEGIVTKAGMTAPKLVQSMHVHKHNEDGYVEQRDHRDLTSFVTPRNVSGMPQEDKEGRALEMDIGLSIYKDYQRFNIQEAPDNAPPGQIPRSIEVICEGELCEKAKPGDRVQVTGVYKSFPVIKGDFTNGIWPARLIATNVTLLKELTEAPFVADDVKNIKNIAAREDAFKLLARSCAPSICGHEKVKAGLLLQMIGGTEKNLENGTHLRGDINILMVGDPSCGKSQMLRFVMNTSPLAISTTGRGSSGVGLTAAMVRDSTTREFTLEAGAMVLADRGVICIDEFDKMAYNDRVAIHEAMEQQCVTIAKAGMHVTLNARCSVTAAANPKYGSFDPSLTLAKNIGLEDSLLSRFDLIYIVRDLTTEEIDRKIATQVLRQAMQRLGGEGSRRGVEYMHSSILERRQEVDQRRNQEAAEVFVKGLMGADGQQQEVLTVDFLRKYIRYCKRLSPVLTEEAREKIAVRYSEMRMRFQIGFDPNTPADDRKPRLAVTTRTLEALIRLATAHAKLKLRKEEVLPEDVEEAYKLMLIAREEELPSELQEAEVEAVAAASSAAATAGAMAANASGAAASASGSKRRRGEAFAGQEGEGGGISAARFKSMQTLVARSFATSGGAELPRGELLEKVNAGLSAAETRFSQEEFSAGLARLEAQNKVMIIDDEVHQVG
mmetsp:Transcript_17799/g.38119  ORF Transcript_17799/g.38119 Transcript_17799/m.38119 type:complete len:808 (+) Transcript_17799:121-2544(+)|eukprot:CAMPEP_0206444954 /NCGR_PEP_ID=MMETSP0324_2-20121206/15207_1 /ASSEMBLY_ACC=CAM_ASM_000836 /TAXON_ID=2866 /ORGANISM="Crypthecodinium cohnii, Strain Seligo" /LENGTH=807 /DNA_ID=CAMNT_0053913051 /DNA_START=39 /DNA_END=2462 /DNA_ORIENTATION=+